MNENYVKSVRESLYTDKKRKVMPRTQKKIVFALSDYKSESVFSSPKITKQRKTAKLNGKPKKRKKTIASDSSGELYQPRTERSHKLGKSYVEQKHRRDPSDDENERYDMSPSKSETSLNNTGGTSPCQKTDFILSTTSNEDTQESFTLSDFFDTREHSLNESVTEAHSGIDYEFISNAMEKAEISNRKICVEDDVEVVIPEDEETQSGDEVLDPKPMETEEDSPSPIERPKIAETFEIGCETLVVMKEHGNLPFFGLFSIKVLHGEIEILGCVLQEKSQEMKVYSPRGSSLLSIINSSNSKKTGKLSEAIPSLAEIDSLKDVHIDRTTAIFVCKKINDPKITFIEKYISQQIFPKTDKKELPQVIFEPKGDWNVVIKSSEWDTILKRVKPSTKLLIAGGKGVGKSTFVRYALNRLLNMYKKIRVVDLDPGQSEFTIPGCVSYLTVTEPILGPNYSHLKKTERSYLCNINVGHDPKHYLYGIKCLMKDVDALEENIPTIINYMGFSTGIGLNIISAAIILVRPTDVVQIDSSSRKKNFQSALSVGAVNKNCGLFAGDSPDAPLKYNLHRIRAMSDGNSGWSLEPRQVREMCVLADLGRMMTDQVQSLTDWRLPMFEISLSSIAITDAGGAPLSPAAVNASLVALCARRRRSDAPFACLGYGVVRGVDPVGATLTLTTPLDAAALEEARHLVAAGGVSLPPSVHMTVDEVVGHVPYVMRGELVSLGQITRRSYLPANKK